MTPDESYALLVLAFLGITITQKQFTPVILELLLKLSRPGATVALLALLVWVYIKGLHYTFLALAVLVVFLLKDVWTYWVRSDARRLYLEIGRDNDRFDPSLSIDLQMANGTVTHAAPAPMRKDFDASHLLVFPPSAATLAELSGP